MGVIKSVLIVIVMGFIAAGTYGIYKVLTFLANTIGLTYLLIAFAIAVTSFAILAFAMLFKSSDRLSDELRFLRNVPGIPRKSKKQDY